MVFFALNMNGLKNSFFMKKVTVFGSTKEEVHIGCKALTSGLEKLIYETYGGDTLIKHVSHRYLSPHFNDVFFVTKLKTRRKFFTKEVACVLEKNRSEKNWLASLKSLEDNDIFLKLTIQSSDIVIINVEGTLHHKGLLGHQLLAIGALAVKLNKPVYWVNVSVESEDDEIIKKAFSGARQVSVRDKFSYSYLMKLGVNAVLAFDTAVLADYVENNIVIDNFLPDVPFCLFTGSNVKEFDLLNHAKVIYSHGIKPLYIPLGLNDYDDLNILKENNISCLDYGQLDFTDVIALIKKSEFVISGRHHLNIFCLLAGKPFIAYKSNTWKIEGVMDMLEYDYDYDLELYTRVKNLLDNYDNIASSLKGKINCVKKEARKNL